MKKDIIESFNLPSFLKKADTISDGSKLIEKAFEGKEDKISKETKEDLLKRLAIAQEYIKAQNGIPAQPQQQMMFGGGGFGGGGGGGGGMGFMNFMGSMGGSGGGGGQQSQYLDETNSDAVYGTKQDNQAMGQVKDQVSSMFGVFGKAARQTQKMGQSIGNSIGGEVGSQVAHVFSPEEGMVSTWKDKDATGWEKATAVVTGGISSHRRKKERERKAKDKQIAAVNSSYAQSDFKMGGMTKQYDWGGYTGGPGLDPYTQNIMYNASKGQYSANAGIEPYGINDFSRDPVKSADAGIKANGVQGKWGDSTEPLPYNSNAQPTHFKENKKADLSGVGKWAKNHYADLLRYAPVLANALQLKNLKKPNYERLDKLDKRYKHDYVDLMSLVNLARDNESTSRRALLNASGGDLSAARASLLGNALQSNRGISEAFIKAEGINREENRLGQRFNLQVDSQNMRQSNLENDINARNLGAYRTAKSKLIGQLGTDIGNIGKEEKYKMMVKQSGLCYDANGAYICGSGERLTDEQVGEIKRTSMNKYGGYQDSASSKLFTNYLDSITKK